MTQVQIFIDKDDLIGSKYVSDFIMKFLLENDISGATMFKGWMGFGKNHVLKKPNDIFSFDETPLLITFIDNDEKVDSVLLGLRKEYEGGLIVKNIVQVV